MVEDSALIPAQNEHIGVSVVTSSAIEE